MESGKALEVYRNHTHTVTKAYTSNQEKISHSDTSSYIGLQMLSPILGVKPKSDLANPLVHHQHKVTQ